MENDIEYIQLFMEYESDDMPVVYFYEVDLKDNRFALRAIEVFADRTVKLETDLYCDVIEVCPIPTVDEFNTKVWGEISYTIIEEHINLMVGRYLETGSVFKCISAKIGFFHMHNVLGKC